MMEGKKEGWRDENISSNVVASHDLNFSKPWEEGEGEVVGIASRCKCRGMEEGMEVWLAIIWVGNTARVTYKCQSTSTVMYVYLWLCSTEKNMEGLRLHVSGFHGLPRTRGKEKTEDKWEPRKKIRWSIYVNRVMLSTNNSLALAERDFAWHSQGLMWTGRQYVNGFVLSQYSILDPLLTVFSWFWGQGRGEWFRIIFRGSRTGITL